MAVMNDRQLRILRVIDEGHTTGAALSDVLGSSMQMLSYHINQMVDDGYIRAAKVYDNELRDFVVVRAYLTPEGHSLLATQPNQTPVAATVTAENPGNTASYSAEIHNAESHSEGEGHRPERSSATMSSASNPADPNMTQTAIAESALDYVAVGESIERLEQIVAALPIDWRELAEVYLDDLKGEINPADRRRSVRIKAYFLALLRTLLPVIGKISQGDEFVQQVRVLSQQLAIPVRLPGD
jgi:DeoR family transcriptional regulator, catabolite repression regulator